MNSCPDQIPGDALRKISTAAPPVLTMMANAVHPAYSLLPLRDGEIRVFIVEPAPHNEPISGSLEIVKITDPAADYAALSYTWGPPFDGYDSSDQEILLCGYPFVVRGNLYDALQRLRKSQEPLRIWIDAISINQKDDVERSKQVSQMAEVFAHARETFAWLGIESPSGDAEITFACLENLMDPQGRSSTRTLQKLAPMEVHGRNGTEIARRATEPLEYLFRNGRLGSLLERKYDEFVDTEAPLIQPKQEDPDSLACSDTVYFVYRWVRMFFRRRYWKRRWVLQELFHSKCTTVFCGAHEIEQSQLLDFHHRLRVLGRSCKQALPMQPPALRPQLLSSVYEAPSARLVDRMVVCCQTKCEDARDKAFALLSLDEDPCIQADYTASTAQIWTRLATACVKDGLSAWVLETAANEYAFKPHSEPCQPSWVPDFSNLVLAREPSNVPDTAGGIVPDQDILTCGLYHFGEISTDGTHALFQTNEPVEQCIQRPLNDPPRLGPDFESGDLICSTTADSFRVESRCHVFLVLRQATQAGLGPETRHVLVGGYEIPSSDSACVPIGDHGVLSSQYDLPELASKRRTYYIQ